MWYEMEESEKMYKKINLHLETILLLHFITHSLHHTTQ